MKRLDDLLVITVTAAIAVAGARNHARSWNDGSHLAAAESLVDRGTFAIDDSIFVKVPSGRSPYAPGEPVLAQGTRDRVFIGGRYYSDKPPVVSLLLAGLYALLGWVVGLDAAADPERFCRWMARGASGLAYVVAVWCVLRTGAVLGLGRRARIALAASLALSTLALPYSRAVNQHELLLAVAAALFLVLARLARFGKAGTGALLGAGGLAGLGYTFDLGSGPPLLALSLAVVALRTRRAGAVALFALAALPPLVLHHAVTWAIGGTLGPLNAVPDHFRWPGSPFDESNLTGRFRRSFGEFLVYAAALLFGKRGFAVHNLPILLLIPAAPAAWRRSPGMRLEIGAALAWCASTWLIYALLSDNYSGACVSVRWFVPLLAAAYFVLAAFLRLSEERLTDLAVLGSWGAVLSALAWWQGPWTPRMVPFLWPIVAAAAISWFAWRARVRPAPSPDRRRRPWW